jgi:hypothetical protein
MMVLSSAAVLGGRFEEEAGFAAFADFDLAEGFLLGFFSVLSFMGSGALFRASQGLVQVSNRR